MTAVTQTIPSFTFGISEQPDSRKRPGQLTFLDNALPDITSGLVKRPGTRYVSELTEVEGTYFSYFRDGQEQYIGHIAFDDGAVTMWNALTGVKQTFDGSNKLNYLKHSHVADIQTYTISDVTYLTNRTKSPKMTSAKSGTRKPEAVYEVKTLAYGREYRIDLWNVKSDGTRGSKAVPGGATYSTPGATVDDTNKISTQTILSNLKSEIEDANAGFTVDIIGNILYITRKTKFLISTSDTQLGNAFSNRVNKLSRLPYQCKAGYEVEVVDEQEEDGANFYVKFVGQGGDAEADTPTFGGDGEGYWAEWIGQGEYTTIDKSTMPVTLTRQANGEFKLSTIKWDKRKVGDDNSNPLPSFINQDDPEDDGNPINAILLFRNRLVFLNDGNIMMSSAGDFTNLFSFSQLSIGASDPIDISVSSKEPATLYNGIELTSGFLLFGQTAQFLLYTDNDLLTQETASVTAVSQYEFDIETQPISLGTTFGFCNTGGRNFRFFEMQSVTKDGEPTVDELSKIVSRYLPSSISSIADSKEEQLILFATDDPAFVQNGIGIGSRATEVWGYRYFTSGRERLQSSWFRWTMPGRVLYHTVMSDTYYVVLDINGQVQLHEGDIKSQDDTAFIIDLPEAVYRIHLDNRQTIESADMTYNQTKDVTTFDLPSSIFNLADTVVDGQTIVEGVPTPAPAEVTQLTDIDALDKKAKDGGLTNGDVYDVLDSTGAQNAETDINKLPLPNKLWSDRMTVRVKWNSKNNNWDYQAHFPTTMTDYRKVACYTIAESANQGRLAFPAVNGTTVKLKGNWKEYLEVECTNQGELNDLVDGEYHNMKTKCTAKCGSGSDAARNLRVSIRVTNQRIARVWIVDPGENYTDSDVETVQILDGEVERVSDLTTDIFSDAEFSVTAKTTDLDIGYLFRMSLQLPKFFPTRTEGTRSVSDTRCSLIIHRMNLDIGPTGNWQVTLKRKGREDWTERYTGPYFDYYKADDPALVPEMRMTVPCYERNTNLTVDLWSEHPSPFTLYTLSWEGDYSNKFYQRV